MQATILNFLTELDRDMFIENKKVPYGRFIPNMLKNLYRVSASAHARAHKCHFFCSVCVLCPGDFSVTVSSRMLKFGHHTIHVRAQKWHILVF